VASHKLTAEIHSGLRDFKPSTSLTLRDPPPCVFLLWMSRIISEVRASDLLLWRYTSRNFGILNAREPLILATPGISTLASSHKYYMAHSNESTGALFSKLVHQADSFLLHHKSMLSVYFRKVPDDSLEGQDSHLNVDSTNMEEFIVINLNLAHTNIARSMCSVLSKQFTNQRQNIDHVEKSLIRALKLLSKKHFIQTH
jgi:hypothetical protein